VKRISPPRPRLDVRDLEIILALAASGSTVKAAASLHVTQSAVSRGLHGAETRIGLRLFDRTARGLVPTVAGERLIRGAGAVLGDLVALEREVAAPVVAPLELRVACECYTAYRWLPSTLARLRQTLPRASVTLAPEHTAAPALALADDAIDVALLTTSPAPPGVLEEPLFTDEIVFIVARSHPLARRPRLTRKDLLEHTLISSTQTPVPEQRAFVRRVFGSKVPPLRFIAFPLTEAIVDAARAGMGIAVLSEWIASTYLEAGDLVLRRLDRRIERPWRIAFRRPVADAARQLAAALQHAAPRVVPAAVAV